MKPISIIIKFICALLPALGAAISITPKAQHLIYHTI